MSRVASTKIVGQVFKPIVTDLTYDELDEIREKNQSINISNSIIFSVPIKTEEASLSELNGIEDIAGEASIWITDYNGNLQPITFPYNKISGIIKYYEDHIMTSDTKVIADVDWNNNNQIITGFSGSIPQIDTNIRLSYTNGKFDIVRASSLKIYTDELKTPYNEASYWYNTLGSDDDPRTYYITAIVPFNGKEYETTNFIQCTIKAADKNIPNVQYETYINNVEGTITIVFTAEQTGKIHLICESELTEIQKPNENLNWSPNTALVYVYKNTTENDITGLFTYYFTPQNLNKYEVKQETFTTNVIQKPRPKTPYYFYVGLTKPTSSTTISSTASAQQTGWHLIGDSIDGYSASSPVYVGGIPSQTINVNADYEDVDFYVAIPVGLNLHDGLGNIIDSLFLDTSNVTINEHPYNIFKIYNSDFLATIY